MKDIFEEIERDDLTPDLGLLADAIGIEPTRDLLRKNVGYVYLYPSSIAFGAIHIEIYEEAHTNARQRNGSHSGVSSQYLLKLKRKYDL